MANVVEANLLACKAEGVGGDVFNVACGERFTLLDLVRELNQILTKQIEPIFNGERKGDVRHSLADIGKAEDRLSYSPLVNFNAGLKKTVDWA